MIFIKNLLVLLSGKAGEQLIGLILVPILTRSLNPSQFGQLELLQTISMLAILLIVCDVWTIVGKRLLSSGVTADDNARNASAGLHFILLSGAGFVLIYFAFLPYLLRYVLPPLPTGVTLVFPFVVATSGVYQYFVTLLQNGGYLKKSRVVSLSISSLNLLLAIGLIVFLDFGVLGVLLAQLCGYVFGSIVCAYYFKEYIRQALNVSAVVSVISSSIGILPASISLYLVSYSDRWFLKSYATIAEIGVYGFASRLSVAINGIIFMFASAYSLEFYRESERMQNGRLKLLLFACSYSLCCIFLAGSLFFPEVVALLAPSGYAGASFFGPIFLFSFSCFSLGSMLWIELIAQERGKAIGIGTSLAGLASFGGNMLLVPRLGVTGALIVNVVTYTCLLLGMVIYLKLTKSLITGGWVVLLALFGSGGLVFISALFSLPLLLKVCYFLVSVALIAALFISRRDVRDVLLPFIRRHGMMPSQDERSVYEQPYSR